MPRNRVILLRPANQVSIGGISSTASSRSSRARAAASAFAKAAAYWSSSVALAGVPRLADFVLR